MPDINSIKIRSPLRLTDLGKSGIMVTELGFGGIPIMRVDVNEAKLVIEHCFELGIRFFDTAHMYGDSEEKLGKALEPFRDQVIIATKVWAKDGKGAADQLAMSLERLRTNCIDLIQCHNIAKQEDLEKVLGPGGAYEVLAEAKAEGKVRAIGFSSHNPDIAAKGCRLGKFATLQFPFNFIEHDPLEKVFPAALEQGMGIIAMKPLGGGLLERADLCFRFLQEHPKVIPIPGIQSYEDIDEIVRYYRNRRPLSQDDWEEIRGIRSELGTRFCHRCEYCMPCEQGVQIPGVLMVKTQVRRFGYKQVVAMAKDRIATVENCVECGECVERCPYGLPIPDMLQESLEIYQRFLSKRGPGS
jgi:predicted aldo/keto reductase-like oxidoreductase